MARSPYSPQPDNEEDEDRTDMLTKPPREVWDHLALVMQVGLTFIGSVLFCLYLGYQLDHWLGTKGVFITVFILLGIAGGGYTAYRQIMDLEGGQGGQASGGGEGAEGAEGAEGGDGGDDGEQDSQGGQDSRGGGEGQGRGKP